MTDKPLLDFEVHRYKTMIQTAEGAKWIGSGCDTFTACAFEVAVSGALVVHNHLAPVAAYASGFWYNVMPLSAEDKP